MKIYMLGICGTAMAQVALLLRQMGHLVVGTDQNFFEPIAGLLKENRIQTWQGYAINNLKQVAPDVVIVGNVISRGNPEIEFLLDTRAFPFYSFPEFLESVLFRQRDMWVVTGTHGKTTTTSILAFLLQQVCTPGYMIGGLPHDFKSGSALGDENAPFVIEGDEYDTAFFDKRSKFFHYWPRTLLINNLEFDHADIFRDLLEIQRSFYQLIKMLPQTGHLVLNGDDKEVLHLLPCEWSQVHSVGVGENNQWQIRNFSESASGIKFDLFREKRCVYANIDVPLIGLFNARNVAMACAACYENGCRVNPVQFKAFAGVERRQKILKASDSFILMEDFGHHPTAICATLESLRSCYRQHRIIACFEPACNTSSSAHFQKEAERAFCFADEVWLLPAKTRIYSDRFVQDIFPIDLDKVQQDLSQKGKGVLRFSSYEDFSKALKTLPDKSTVVCAFSNGKLSEFLHEFVKKGDFINKKTQ